MPDQARLRTIVVDGSNATHAIFGDWPGSRGQRNSHEVEFLQMLSQWIEGRQGLEVEAVFDGGSRSLVGRGPFGAVRILFSEHETADSVIIERIRALRFYHKKVTVVTWDQDLATKARAEEARVISPARLFEAMKAGVAL